MAFDRFLIAPFNTGLQQNLRPFLIMDDAFETLENAYVFRGRLRKRFGSVLMGTSQLTSRLRVQVGTNGAQISPIPGNQFNIGQMFSVGPDIFTVYQNGAMLSTNPLASGTFNTANGAFTITDPSQIGATPVYWYPALPVMGITQYQKGAINNQPSYAFDTEFAYLFNGTAWQRSGLAIWHGSNLNFFDVCNWEGITPNVVVMFVTNFNATIGAPGANDDPIWYTPDGTNWVAMLGSSANGIFFLPNNLPRYTGPYVQTCRLIVAFKNRLLLLNTIENNNPNGNGTDIPTISTNTSYVNRCRYSHNGSPLAQNAWYEPNQMDSSGTPLNQSIADGGGWIDATTEEAIVSAEFIKDRLIVFFERSTWELAYTGNEKQPFIWQKINTELGSESQCSTVPFDKEILAIGNTGVHACNGANVVRIDDKIPDIIFDIKDKDLGVQRVAGIRDYFVEMVYWSFPAQNADPNFVYPNRLLVYNYRNGSWSINRDCFTAFGYWEQSTDITWANSAPLTWGQADFQWNSGENQQQFRQIIAGNQEGFVMVIRPNEARNAESLQITNITAAFSDIITLKVIDHTLATGEFILIENDISAGLNGLIFKIYASNVAANTIQIEAPTFTGTYTGGATIARVSNLNILSKQWNPYDKVGRNLYLAKIDFAVQNTGGTGQVTVDYFPSSSEVSMLNQAEPGVTMGTGVLETSPYALVQLEQAQAKLWHSVYFQTDGNCVQIEIYWSDAQMLDKGSSLVDFELEGLVLHTSPTANRLQ